MGLNLLFNRDSSRSEPDECGILIFTPIPHTWLFRRDLRPAHLFFHVFFCISPLTRDTRSVISVHRKCKFWPHPPIFCIAIAAALRCIGRRRTFAPPLRVFPGRGLSDHQFSKYPLVAPYKSTAKSVVGPCRARSNDCPSMRDACPSDARYDW